MTGELTAQDFTMFSGDDKALRVTVTDDDGNAVDITGSTAKWKLAKSSGSAAALVSKTTSSGIALTTPASGILTITLDAADTDSLKGTYYHELEITDASGNITTVMYGTATILRDLIHP